TSSSTTKKTWSLGSSPGWSALTASSIALVDSMWMHFQGQMSTQPSHRMHSAWSMCRNCLGLTDWVSHLGSTSCSTYEVENSGIGGFASVFGTSGIRWCGDGAAVRGDALFATGAQPADRTQLGLVILGEFFFGGDIGDLALLPHDEQCDVDHQHHDVDTARH